MIEKWVGKIEIVCGGADLECVETLGLGVAAPRNGLEGADWEHIY